jgi:hypothetical protein
MMGGIIATGWLTRFAFHYRLLRRSIVSGLLFSSLHTSFHSTFAVLHAFSPCRGQRGKSDEAKFKPADRQGRAVLFRRKRRSSRACALTSTSRIPVSASWS